MRTPALAASITEEFRTQSNISPLVVRVCAVDAENTDRAVWHEYARELVRAIVGDALDVSATYTPGAYDRQAVQVTFTVPDDGQGSTLREALRRVAGRHGVRPYMSWTETPGRLRLDRW